jgi:hypothetical protein
MWVPDRQFLAFPPEYRASYSGPGKGGHEIFLLSRNFAPLCESDFARNRYMFAFGFRLAQIPTLRNSQLCFVKLWASKNNCVPRSNKIPQKKLRIKSPKILLPAKLILANSVGTLGSGFWSQLPQ